MRSKCTEQSNIRFAKHFKMKLVFAFAATLLVATVAQGRSIPEGRVLIPDFIRPNSDEMINFINSMGTTWKVHSNGLLRNPNTVFLPFCF